MKLIVRADPQLQLVDDRPQRSDPVGDGNGHGDSEQGERPEQQGRGDP
jgi:hypothetical protein